MKQSAGILLFRRANKYAEVFLVHPGGPYWRNKDEGAWSIPKGEFNETEDALTAAIREFKEETGMNCTGNFSQLPVLKQKAGKLIYTWALEGNINAEELVSNSFELEWPPKSGRIRQFPEIDKGCWFTLKAARIKINPAQCILIDALDDQLKEK